MLTQSVRNMLALAEKKLAHDPKLLETFKNCFVSTLETTTKCLPDGDSFVFTGDIPAMWLRDSSAQVRHYLPLAMEDPALRRIIEGLISRQAKCILRDPYANAFNEEEAGASFSRDITETNGWEWERKFEVDSLCYPVQLAWLYWKRVGGETIFTPNFQQALWRIVETFQIEQHHGERSNYRFVRPSALEEGGRDTETLQNDGRGLPVNDTGMIWSGFRPSDDACTFGYLIPSNMFAWVILGYIADFADTIYYDGRLSAAAKKLSHEIGYGIEHYAIYRHPVYGPIYAYETDGFGNYTLMDDANVPSLLSIPYLGYKPADDPLYQNTRRFVLSRENPFYYEGTCARGIGSPHTPEGFIWHIALTMQGLTTPSRAEKLELLRILLVTDAGCGAMHEGFDANNPAAFTRPWFAWANSLFSELVWQIYFEDAPPR